VPAVFLLTVGEIIMKETIYDAFKKQKAPKPILLYADVSNNEDTKALLGQLKQQAFLK